MELVNPYTILAAIIAALGFWLGHKSKKTPPPPSGGVAEAKEVLKDHVEEVAEAGNNFATSMGKPVADRVRDILRKYRERTGK